MEWPAPDTKVEDFHEDETKSDVGSQALDGEVLRPSNGKASVHDQDARLDSPSIDHQYESR